MPSTWINIFFHLLISRVNCANKISLKISSSWEQRIVVPSSLSYVAKIFTTWYRRRCWEIHQMISDYNNSTIKMFEFQFEIPRATLRFSSAWRFKLFDFNDHFVDQTSFGPWTSIAFLRKLNVVKLIFTYNRHNHLSRWTLSLFKKEAIKISSKSVIEFIDFRHSNVIKNFLAVRRFRSFHILFSCSPSKLRGWSKRKEKNVKWKRKRLLAFDGRTVSIFFPQQLQRFIKTGSRDNDKDDEQKRTEKEERQTFWKHFLFLCPMFYLCGKRMKASRRH